MADGGFPNVSKYLKGATFGNPYEKPYALNTYTQNEPPPTGTGGGPPYVNPLSVIDKHFFDPESPNDPAFSMDESPNEQSTADPIGAIMADFDEAKSRLFNNGGK